MEALLDYDLLLVVVVGFAAQVVDGALGMAYGVTASSLLLGLGVPPAVSSATATLFIERPVEPVSQT